MIIKQARDYFEREQVLGRSLPYSGSKDTQILYKYLVQSLHTNPTLTDESLNYILAGLAYTYDEVQTNRTSHESNTLG